MPCAQSSLGYAKPPFCCYILCSATFFIRTPMLYHIYEAQRSLMEPFADFAQASSKLYSAPLSPLSQAPFAQRISAGYDLLYRLGKDYEKPAFGIPTVSVDGVAVAIH